MKKKNKTNWKQTVVPSPIFIILKPGDINKGFSFLMFFFFIIILYYILFYFILLFRAALTAFGSSQARGRNGATGAAYATVLATLNLSQICDLHNSLWQHQILNPLSKARDQIHMLMNISRVLNPLSHNVNDLFFSF